MYNGIGLTTARGSGTNGYVIRNLSHVRPPPANKNKSQDDFRKAPPAERKPNKELVQHDLKRKVEVQCMELRISLEDDGVDEADIDKKVDDLRQKLMSRIDEVKPRDAKSLQNHETHLLQAAKNEENLKFARAFGIREQDHVEGQAFDRELQEQKKQERMERRQREMERQLERQEEREKEAYRAERRRRYDDEEDDRRSSQKRTRSSNSRRHRRRRSPTPSSSSESSSGSESDSGSDSDSDRGRHNNKRRHQSSRRSRSRSVSSASASSSYSESDNDDRRRRSNKRQRSPSPSSSSGSYSDDSRDDTLRKQRRSS